MPEEPEHRYWKAVQDTLVANHGYTPAKAYLRVTGFRGEWESQANDPEVIFNSEPEELAGQLYEDDNA